MQETRNNCFGSKNVARPFFRRKQLSTSAEMQQQHSMVMVLLPKVLFNHFWKRQFVVLHCHISKLEFNFVGFREREFLEFSVSVVFSSEANLWILEMICLFIVGILRCFGRKKGENFYFKKYAKIFLYIFF